MPPGPDPRPRATDRAGGPVVPGVRCAACGTAVAADRPSCPRCGGATDPAEFGPGGTVWSATVVRVAVAGHAPPYALAYVDLDAGPRVLAHVAGPAGTAPPIGSRVRLVPSGDGDLTVTAGTVDRGTAQPAAGTPG